MRLANFTDYALRLLLMVQEAGGRLVTIEQAALRLRVSRANLMKVANELTSAGFLTGIRGRSGGLKLARPASNIRIGDVVRAMETDFSLVECLGGENDCAITSRCKLPRVIRRARQAFFDQLDAATLADVSLRPQTDGDGVRPRLEADTTDAMDGLDDATESDIGEVTTDADGRPPRQAQAEATRERILRALADVLGETGGDEVMFDEIARAAGVERRTVFRHFANKAELLRAFWEWIGARIGPQVLPGTLDDLLAMPPEVFSGFDAHDAIIRASLHSPSGRAMRLQAVPARRARFAQVAEAGLPDVPEHRRRDFEALAHLMLSASAWETLKDYAGLSGAEAGQTVSRGLRFLLAALRSEARDPAQV